jgi:hypothetical protein
MQPLTLTNFQNFSQEWKKGWNSAIKRERGCNEALFGLMLNLLVCIHESELKKGSFGA